MHDPEDSHYLEEKLFQEIPEDDDYYEQCDWITIVGGMAARDDFIAQAFKKAGDVLIDQVIEGKQVASYEVAWAILYNYRHAIEVYLKVIVNPKKLDHSIKKLVIELQPIYKNLTGQELPNWVKERLLEIDSIDPGSFSFRYTYNKADPKKGLPERDYAIPYEQLVNLKQWRTVMDALSERFESLIQAQGTRER